VDEKFQRLFLQLQTPIHVAGCEAGDSDKLVWLNMG
jgi:hypothetical protein